MDAEVLDLNDLADLEESFGDLDKIDWSRLAVVRCVLWLVARHEEPEITITEVGRRFTVRNLLATSRRVLTKSGVIGEEQDPGNPVPAAEAG
ncbi:MAG: hypothetical protein C0498_01315 [Anaerolinea sp.]|nr:hypothetical protein [Anaerolinea sp.]